MPDSVFWFRRQIGRELDRLRDGGIPAEVLASPVQLLRAQKGRVLHQSVMCSRLSRTAAPAIVPVDLPDLITEPNLCPSCLSVWGKPISDVLHVARTLVSMRERFVARSGRLLPFGEVVSLRCDSWRAKDLAAGKDLTTAVHPALVPLLNEHAQLVDAVVEGYSDADMTSDRRTALHHRCIRERLAPRGALPPHRREDVAHFGGRRRKLTREVLDAAWQEWGRALDRGTTLEAAGAAARAAGAAKAGNRPPAGPQPLSTARINPAWVAARDQALSQIVTGWTRELAEAVTSSDASSQVLYIRTLTGSVSTGWGANPMLKPIFDLYRPFRHRDEYLVEVPAAVVSCAIAAEHGRSGYDKVKSLGPAQNDDWVVYETAFALRDGDQEHQDLAHHLNVARLALRAGGLSAQRA